MVKQDWQILCCLTDKGFFSRKLTFFLWAREICCITRLKKLCRSIKFVNMFIKPPENYDSMLDNHLKNCMVSGLPSDIQNDLNDTIF